MAKFHATAFPAAALLLCFFTVAIARSKPSSDDSAATSQLALPHRLSSPDSAEKLSSPDPAALRLSSPDPALRLPSESDAKLKTESDPSSAVVTAVPLTEVTFRPINRRFHVRSKRPCRQHFKFYPTMGDNEISYGNDMILSAGENSDFEQPMVRGGGKRIPGRWMRMHHHHRLRRRRDEDTDSDSDDEKEDHTRRSVFKRYDFDRFDREKRLNKLRHHFRARVEEAEKKKRSGFMFRVRKFLDHYI